MENEPPPNGIHGLGWHGLRLQLPAEWNLSAFHGTARKGSLTVSDLRGPQLIARWHKPARWRRHPNPVATKFQKLSTSLRRRQPAAEFSAPADHAAADRSPHRRAAAAGPRPRAALPDCTGRKGRYCNDLLIPSFLQAHREAASRWQWQAFGIRGSAPAYARLHRARLQPGAPEITLVFQARAITFGALSLADRLLANSTLQHAAQKHLHLARLPGEWHDDGSALRFSGRARRKLLPGTIPFGFHILHDTAANQIRWDLTTRPEFYKIWRS